MCLIVFAWQLTPSVALTAAANRDEFHARPTQAAHWWTDHPDIYAGRDLEAGGTWMGIHRTGRFAAVTNFRAPGEMQPNAQSRGELVANYLSGTLSPQDYIRQLAQKKDAYNGFNLLVGDRCSLIWYSNRAGDDIRNGQPLPPGLYGLSNALLDTPWPKVTRAKAQFCSLLCQGAPDDAYLELLADQSQASDCRLPDTGVGLEKERMLSPICIAGEHYGTRTSTLVRIPARGEPVLREATLDTAALLREQAHTERAPVRQCKTSRHTGEDKPG